ncbi:MAG TPA: hypothetical protein VEJ45_06300 [Candidatus Acidoferrales bacterium]|nr:hypothetical protein [Candidatus Acidoferrales bacterium]
MAALMRYGVPSYIENANVSMKALIIDRRIFPLAINTGTSQGCSSYVCSPYAHYLSYTTEEFAKRHSLVSASLLRALALPFGGFLRSVGIDRVAFINNWLFSTNPSAELSYEQIRAATMRVLEEYPDFAIVFRSVNSLLDQSLCKSLIENGYRLVRSRRVYVLDARNRRHFERYNTQTDLKFLSKSSYSVITCQDKLEQSASRMAELYQALYLSKHSPLNPHLNAQFFHLALREKILTFVGLGKDGRIDGFVTYFVQGDRMTGAVLGYDLGMPQKIGLYRMLVAILIAEASQQGHRLNLSGGVGHFKMLRGALPVEEYDAVYDRHLRGGRRLAWGALRMGSRLGSRTKLPLPLPEQSDS